MQLDT